MSFSYIKTKVDNLPSFNRGDELVLDQDFLGSAELIAIFQQTLEQDALILDCQFRESNEDLIRFTGFAEILHQTPIEVDISIIPSGDSFRFVMKMLIPQGWHFSDSFSDLPLWSGGAADQVDTPTLMDTLSFGASHLILTNEIHTNEEFETELVPGLNFAGEVLFMGPIATLGEISSSISPMRIAGPVDEYRTNWDPLEFRGIRLSADIPLDIDLGTMTLNSARVMLKSSLREGDTDYSASWTNQAGIYVLLDIDLDGRSLEIICRFDPINTGTLRFLGYFTDFALGGLGTLTANVGGDDLEEQVPEDVGTLSGLNLIEFGFTVDLANKTLSAIHAKVGTEVSWDVIPEVITIDELSLGFYISHPFTANKRSVDLGIGGLITVGEAQVGLEALIPSYQIAAELTEGTPSLGDAFAAVAPGMGDFPAVNVDTLNLIGNAKSGNFQVSAKLTELGSIPIGETSLEFEQLAVYAKYQKNGTSEGAFDAVMSLGEARANIQGTVGEETTFSGYLENISLKQLYGEITGGEELPDEVPEIAFDTLGMMYNVTTGAFELKGNATFAYEELPFEGSLTTEAEFIIARTVTQGGTSDKSAYTIGLSLSGTGPVEFAKDFTMESFNLNFAYSTGAGWTLGGTLVSTLFDTQILLGAAYTTTPTGKKFELTATSTPATELIAVADMFSYEWSLLELAVETTAAGKNWNLRLVSTLKVPTIFTLGGDLSIFAQADGGKGLSFRPTPDPILISIPGGEGLEMSLTPFEFAVKKEAQSGWSVTGTADIGFTGDVLGDFNSLLPAAMRATLTLGQNECRISALNPTGPITFSLPKAGSQELGDLVLQFTEIGVSLRPELGIVCEVGLGFPQELNDYFRTTVFRVYEPENIMSMARMRVTVGAGGINLQFITSPFVGSNAIEVEGEAWMDLDFGQYGKIAFKLPNFRYDALTQYFEASGGFEIIEPLALPLSPLHMLLKGVGMDAASDIFPEKLPLKGLKLVDENNDLKMDEFIDFVEEAGSLPAEVKSGLEGAGDLFNRFPDTFKSYFDIDIPSKLEFKFGFSPAGRVAFELLAPEEPVKFLFSGMVPGYVLMPGLIGMEVRKITIGTLLSGTLFYGDVDVIIDMFDLPGLAMSLALPSDPAFPLPTSDELNRRVILNNVFSVIPLSQGIPIPIPLFYDEIGLEYMGLEGVGLQAHIGFPAPDFAAGGTALMQELQSFFTDRDHFMDPQAAPAGEELKFVFHDEFLQLPEYLGGQILGTSGSTTEVGTWKYVAQLMNFCKRISINDLINSTPIEHRIGNKSTSFAFMNFDAQWLITTPQEFRDGAFEELSLNANQTQDFLDVLPGVQTGEVASGNNEEGIVTFLRGAADLGFMSLETTFGLAASGSMGFNTGFKFEGSFADVIEMELKGAVLINADEVEGGQALTYPAPVPVPPPTPILDTSIAEGKALTFSGSGTYVKIPFHKSLQLTEYTVEAWVKVPAGSATRQIIGRTNRNYGIRIKSGGSIEHLYSMVTDGMLQTEGATFAYDEWVHVAVTYNNEKACTYINGNKTLVHENPAWLTESNDALYIGKDVRGRSQYFLKGQLSEVRIWKKAKSLAEIDRDKRERMKGDEMDLVSCYHFDADTGNKAIDACGVNHGTIYNGSFTDSSLQILDALYFNGESDYIEIPNPRNLNLTKYTIVAWVLPEEIKDIKRGIIGKKGRNYVMRLNSKGQVSHAFRTKRKTSDGIKATVTKSLSKDKWSRVVIANSDSVARTDINGSQKSIGQVQNGGLAPEDGSIFIGKDHEGRDSNYFKGKIAEIQIWKKYRSASQIDGEKNKRLSGRESNLVALWRPGTARNGILEDPRGINHGVVHVAAAESPVAESGNSTPALRNTQPAPSGDTKAIQVYGHTHLTIAGHQALQGDLRIVDDEFYFKGTLNLFPDNWPLRVFGETEAVFNSNSFYLRSESTVALAGLTLSESIFTLTHEMMRLEGKWLGLNTLLDIQWAGNDPHITGSVSASFHERLDLGTLHYHGVKIGDNVRLDVDFDMDISLNIDKHGFGADVEVDFSFDGRRFSLDLHFDVAFDGFSAVINRIKNAILKNVSKYLSHLVGDAAAWLESMSNGAVELASQTGEAMLRAFVFVYSLSGQAAAEAMHAAGYAVEKVSEVLSAGYGFAASSIANVLKDVGYGANAIADGLVSIGESFAEVGALLKGIGVYASTIGNALKHIGTGYQEAAEIMIDVYSLGHSARVLKNAYGKSAGAVASVFKGLSKNSEEVMKALKAEFSSLDSDDLAAALKSGGYASKYIAKAVKKVLDKGTKNCGKILKRLGYSKGTVEDALDYAGYSWSSIKSVINSIF